MVVKSLNELQQDIFFQELKIYFTMEASTEKKFPHQFLLEWHEPTPVKSGEYRWPKEIVGTPLRYEAKFWARVLDNHFLLQTFPNYKDIAPINQLDPRVFGIVELEQVQEANTRLYNKALDSIREIERRFPLTVQLYHSDGTPDTKMKYHSKLIDQTNFKPIS